MTSALLRHPLVRRSSEQLFNLVGHLLTPRWDRRLLGLGGIEFKTIIDIGANRGQFAQRMRRRFPQAQIIAFEPLPEPYRLLLQWGDRQGQKVRTHNLALGAEVTELKINSHLLFSASSSLLPTTALCEQLYPMVREQETVTVQQSTLDREMAYLEGQWQTPLLVKIDVQGYEDRVIEGGRDTLQRARACILEVSLDGLYQGQCQFRDVFQLLDKLGFTYGGNLDQMVARDGHVRYLNALFWRND